MSVAERTVQLCDTLQCAQLALGSRFLVAIPSILVGMQFLRPPISKEGNAILPESKTTEAHVGRQVFRPLQTASIGNIERHLERIVTRKAVGLVNLYPRHACERRKRRWLLQKNRAEAQCSKCSLRTLYLTLDPHAAGMATWSHGSFITAYDDVDTESFSLFLCHYLSFLLSFLFFFFRYVFPFFLSLFISFFLSCLLVACLLLSVFALSSHVFMCFVVVFYSCVYLVVSVIYASPSVFVDSSLFLLCFLRSFFVSFVLPFCPLFLFSLLRGVFRPFFRY